MEGGQMNQFEHAMENAVICFAVLSAVILLSDWLLGWLL